MKMTVIQKKRNNRGNVFILTMITVAILTIIVGSVVQFSGTEAVQSRKQNDSTQAFIIASSALERIKAELNDPSTTNTFAYYFYSTSPSYTDGAQFPVRCNFFNSSNVATNGASIAYDGVTYTLPSTINMGAELGNYPVSAKIVASRGHADDLNTLYGKGEIILQVSAKYPNTSEGTTRTVKETIRFGISPHKVFDYAYFINNFGWMYANSITMNGDSRSNRNFSFGSYHPKMNGDVYASEDSSGNYGQISGTFVSDSISSWYSRTDTRSRPGNPAISGGANYSAGYDGTPVGYQYQDELEMPYIPSLDSYQQMVADEAAIASGSATTVADVTSHQAPLMSNPLTTDAGGNTVVDPSLGDMPFLAFWDSAAGSYRKVQVFDNTASQDSSLNAIKHKGALLIEGDDSHPIVINGPVVVMGDVLIKGKYVGQGTIFANRNVHIAANLQAVTPPNFPQTDSTPYTTFETNKKKDLMGLVARGNVIAGNYLLSSYTGSVAPYIKPPFTSGYEIEPGDADNGYSNTTINGNAAFNGDYTAWDTGYKNNADGSASTASGNKRKFYQSSVNDTIFTSFAVSDNANMNRIDGVLYNNHLVSGRIGNTIINGTMVARDEALVYSTALRFNYDERIHSSHGEDRLKAFLPYELAKPYTIAWKEGE